ncbi:DoxX family protein [Modestobacter italicus]|uniref:DoxX family protein n=1 Tax=Modestobacter italicus (strain DSM 44449 / CECT 9708 / BC 501) TaxID=2732864 RepID=UPI001C983548|nr:DoxX family protein [Modestobacter italicus]
MTTTHARRRGPAPAAGRTVLLALRIGLAAVFAAAGLAKLGGEPAVVGMFDDIGASAWLRFLVGALEVAGAVGLLVPRLVAAASLGLAGLMVGATVTNLVVLDTSPALTVLLGLVAGMIAWARLTGRAPDRRGLARQGPGRPGARTAGLGRRGQGRPSEVSSRR